MAFANVWFFMLSIATTYYIEFRVIQNDLKLVEGVKNAAKKNTEPAEIEKVVGVPALISSRNAVQRDYIGSLAIEYDAEYRGKVPALSKMKDVMMWSRPYHPAIVVGVYWNQNGDALVYTGWILPPG